MFYDTTNTLFMTSDLLCMTSHPFFRTSHHFMYDIKSTVCFLTSTASVSSHPTYWWHHSQYMEGITCSISVISYPLCFLTKYPLSMTSQHSVLMSPHSAYVWHPLHCRWHPIHSITPNNAIYDVTSTSRITSHTCIRHCTHCTLSSQPLNWYHTQFWMTSHPHSVWHPMPYIEHNIQSLCHHSTVLLTSQPLTMKPYPVCRATYTLDMTQHSHYLCLAPTV